MALQALATVAARTSSGDIDVTVRVDTDESAAVAGFHLDQDNFLLHQSQQVRSGQVRSGGQTSRIQVAHLKLPSSPFR